MLRTFLIVDPKKEHLRIGNGICHAQNQIRSLHVDNSGVFNPNGEQNRNCYSTLALINFLLFAYKMHLLYLIIIFQLLIQ